MMKKTTTTCADRSLCGRPSCLGLLCLTQGQVEESHAPWCIVKFRLGDVTHWFPSVLLYLCFMFWEKLMNG